MQAFNRHILAEEQLCHYGEVRNQNGSEQQQKQMKDAFVKLIHFTVLYKAFRMWGKGSVAIYSVR